MSFPSVAPRAHCHGFALGADPHRARSLVAPRHFRRILSACVLAFALPVAAEVEVKPADDRVTISVDGQLLTELRLTGAPKPYFYPLLGPGGVALTRNYPMRDVEGEDRDHPHQRSLWFTHGDVNGVDFWAEGPNRGRIVHQKILEARSGADHGVLKTANNWVAPDGKVLLTDETTFIARRSPESDTRIFDFIITLRAPDGVDVVFGDTKEGTLGVRLAESMRLKPNQHHAGKTRGSILQNTGAKDGATWGKRAEWTAYSGPVDGKTMTVAILDHPSNPRHPTWWHVRDYGLFAANPFGVHDFERKPAGTGNLTLPGGESLTFRYRFILQEGGADAARLNEIAARFRETRL
jgi:hypothetical protein